MQRPRSTTSRKVLVSIGIVVVLLVLFLSPLAYGQFQDSLKVPYIDVGQGDGILLHASDDTDILIDGGPPQGTLGLDPDDNSVVMPVVYGDMRFTGDISSNIEQSRPGNFERLDIFKPPVFDPSSSFSTPPSTPFTRDFYNEPLIGMLTPDTFQVNVRAKKEGTMVGVSYGVSNLNSNTGIYISTNANEQYNVLEIPLPDIQSSSVYQYRVSWKPPEGRIMMPGPIFAFRSPRVPSSGFKFAVSGDSQQTSHDFVNCIPNDLFDSFGALREYMKTQNYDFTLSLGDEWELAAFADRCPGEDQFTMENTLLSIQYWRDDIDRMNYLAPHFMSPGNHNYDVSWDNNFRVDRAHKARLLSTINPLNNNPPDGDNETYYSFEWGDALFISLNTEFPETLGRHYHQYKWLENTLTNSDKNWKFVFMHRPLVGAPSQKLYPSENTRNHLKNLFAEKGVDVVFQGHHHHYVCQTFNPDNTYDRCYTNLNKDSANKTTFYVISGSGGVAGPLSNPGDLQFMDVQVQGNRVIVRCIDPLTGNLCPGNDSQFMITKPITPPPPR